LGEWYQNEDWMPEYADKTLYGAVAFISEDAGTAAMADMNRLFIRATGDSARIINRDGFQPKTW